jgi:hypothetical protein
MDDVTQLDRPVLDAGYETDFYAWAIDQAARIRALAVPGLDVENVAEEIESLGRSQKSELTTRCRVLLIHLLKWAYQPERRGVSWISTIGEQRDQIQTLLSDSPSLRSGVPGVVANAYRRAAKQATLETNLRAETFPASCPWTPEQILDEDWMPAE